MVSSLSLAALDYVFVQDHLLFPQQFVSEAKLRGFDIELGTLDILYDNGLLIPLFRVGHPKKSEPLVAELPDGYGNSTSRDLVFDAAVRGLLHDPTVEDKVAPITALSWDGSHGEDWTIYLYSPWQLLDLDDLRPALDLVGSANQTNGGYLDRYCKLGGESQAERCRKRTLALAALTPRYLWRVTGQFGLPPGADRAKVFESFTVDPQLLLSHVGCDPENLQKDAVGLLMGITAHRDPCRGLLPIIRHMDFESWMKLRGAALAAIWSRIAAEVLLRCHADLEEAGTVQPLTVDLNRERINRRAVPDLDESLTSFNLSPYPMVLLLAEGETEMEHYPGLLRIAGIDRNQYVQVMRAGTMFNPELLARYAITPRVGAEMSTGWLLSRRPTVLYIIMDPENRWSPAKFYESVDLIRSKISREVQEQGGAHIDDGTLNHIVRAQTWLHLTGNHLTYELANFTVSELIEAMRPLARVSGKYGDPIAPEWVTLVRDDIQRQISSACPEEPAKIGNILKKLSIDKTDLAKALLPVLLKKYESEVSDGTPITPVVRVIEEVRDIVQRARKHIMLPK